MTVRSTLLVREDFGAVCGLNIFKSQGYLFERSSKCKLKINLIDDSNLAPFKKLLSFCSPVATLKDQKKETLNVNTTDHVASICKDVHFCEVS